MTRIALAFMSLLISSPAWADNLIYIDQVGSSATITIDQDGSGNRVGASGDDSKSSGATGHAAPLPGDRKAPCAAHFGEESNSLPTLKQASAAWAGLWLAPPPRPLPVNAPRALGEFTPRPDASLRRERIPIPIAFLRLAL